MIEDASRPLDEVYDTMMEVERDPCGAWMAIQSLAARLEEAEALVMQMISEPDRARAEALEQAAKYHGNFLMTRTSIDVEEVLDSENAVRDLVQP